MYELTRGQQWLYERLRANPVITSILGTRVYMEPADQGAQLPYLLIAHRAGTDTTVGQVRVGTQLVFAIEIVFEDSTYRTLEPIYDTIDSTLQGATGTHRGVIIDQAQRDQNYVSWGAEAGKTRQHIGALWRLFVRPEVPTP